MFKSFWVLPFENFILRDDGIKYKSKKKDGYDLMMVKTQLPSQFLKKKHGE